MIRQKFERVGRANVACARAAPTNSIKRCYGAERKLKQRAGARHQVDLAVTLQSPSEKAASTASGGGGAGNPPGLAQAKNLLVHFQRLWA